MPNSSISSTRPMSLTPSSSGPNLVRSGDVPEDDKGKTSSDLRQALDDKSTLIDLNHQLQGSLKDTLAELKNSIDNYVNNCPTDDEITQAEDEVKNAKSQLSSGSGSASEVSKATQKLQNLKRKKAEEDDKLHQAKENADTKISKVKKVLTKLTGAETATNPPAAQIPQPPAGAAQAQSPQVSSPTGADTPSFTPTPTPTSKEPSFEEPKFSPTGSHSYTPHLYSPKTNPSVESNSPKGSVKTNVKSPGNVSGKTTKKFPKPVGVGGNQLGGMPMGGMPMGGMQPQNSSSKTAKNLSILDESEERVGEDVVSQASNLKKL